MLTNVAAARRIAVAVDMAGHGLYARRPDVIARRTSDFGTSTIDGSPVADITLDQGRLPLYCTDRANRRWSAGYGRRAQHGRHGVRPA